MQEIQSAVDDIARATTTPLPYTTRTPGPSRRSTQSARPGPGPTPPSVSALASLIGTPVRSDSSTVDSYSDNFDDSEDNDTEEEGGEEGTLYNIPGFPLGSSRASGKSNTSNGAEPIVEVGPGTRSPQIVSAGFEARASFNISVDALTQRGPTSAPATGMNERRRTKRNYQNGVGPASTLDDNARPSPLARPPIRQGTNHSETSNVSAVSTMFLAGNSNAATARIMANPEVQVCLLFAAMLKNMDRMTESLTNPTGVGRPRIRHRSKSL